MPEEENQQKTKLIIVIGFFILAVIVFLFLLFDNLGGPEIPKEAIKQPERGLPVED